MKQGKTLEALGAELQRQRSARQDFIADTRNLVMETTPEASTLRVSTKNHLLAFTVGLMSTPMIKCKKTPNKKCR